MEDENNIFVGIGDEYTIELSIVDSNNNAVIDDCVSLTIYDTRNKTYFNGLIWSEDECQISMTHISDGRYTFLFTPDTESIFEVVAKSNKYPFGYLKTIRSMKELGDFPIRITSDNFKNQDGTNSRIIDRNGKPLRGVKISCFNIETKEIISVSQSNDSGEWEMMIPQGKYFFTFEKDGYISVAFERSVF